MTTAKQREAEQARRDAVRREAAGGSKPVQTKGGDDASEGDNGSAGSQQATSPDEPEKTTERVDLEGLPPVKRGDSGDTSERLG